MTTVGSVKSSGPDIAGRPGLAELVDQIRTCTAEAGNADRVADRVAEVLGRTPPEVTLLSEAERTGSSDGYVRHTLHAEAGFSVSAVVWRPGQVTEIHDHLVWCSFIVLQGVETEEIFRRDGDRVVPIGQRRRATGSVSAVAPPDDIHRVRNTDDRVAITLHVYGADLSTGTSVRRTYDLRNRDEK